MKKWFDCAYLFTVILIYGRAVSTFSMTVSTFWFWFFIITRGACELVLGGMVTINVFFPFGELSSRLHPPKNQKTNSDHHFGKKRTVLRTWKRKHHKKIYKKYFNGHLWCKFHTHTNTSIPQHYPQNPVYQWKSILNLQSSNTFLLLAIIAYRPDYFRCLFANYDYHKIVESGLNRNLQANHWTDFGEAYLRTKPVEPSEPAGYSGREMYEIYWKLVMPHRSP